MKEFMLIYKGGDPDWANTASEEEMAAAMDSWNKWMGKLQESDQLVSGGSPLHFSGKSVDHDGVVTDIAVPEFKELVTGYSIVKAKDFDEAVEITKTCPIYQYPNTTTDIREIVQMG